MQYRTLSSLEQKRAEGQFSTRTTEENMAYWFFPECMRRNMKRNYPVAFEGAKCAYYPDFVLLHERIIIEIDGGYHTSLKQKTCDQKKDAIFGNNEYAIIRIKNEDTNVNVCFWERLIENLSKIEPIGNRNTLPSFIKELKAMRDHEVELWTSLDYIPEMSLINSHRHKSIRDWYELMS